MITTRIQERLDSLVNPETYDAEWVDWNPEALREEVALQLDYFIDKRVVLKYYVGTVIGGVEPSFDVTVITLNPSVELKFMIEVTQES